jgi:hypothetical protein
VRRRWALLPLGNFLGMPSSNVSWPAEDELRERLAVIEVAVKSFPGTESFEHLLRDLTELLGSARVTRTSSLTILAEWISTDPWPWGAEETLEFSMRQLHWPEMRSALENILGTASIRVQEQVSRVLEVYEDSWPGGDIYRTYRST